MPDLTQTPAPLGATPATIEIPNPTPAPIAPSGAPPQPIPSQSNGWGDNWRQVVAGEDPKLLARAERYQSPKAVFEALVAAQNKISAGELRAPLTENATPEQLAAYRQQNGIPEKPEGYFEKLPNGLVIGDQDKPLFESFAKGLHERNADPKVAQWAVQWYNNHLEEQTAKVAETDTAQRTEVEDALRTEWGGDYRANINHINGFLSQAPKEVSERIMDARGPDGRAIMNDPNTVRWFAQMAREFNPVGTIVSGTGGNHIDTVETEIASIEKTMRENRTAYNKDERMQGRLRDLYDARSRLQKRA